MPSTRSSTYTGLKIPRPPAGRTNRRERMSVTGITAQGRERGP
jgi:hypothetical protein